MSEHRHLVGGYFYPLNLRRALDFALGERYSEECASRAAREKMSARRSSWRRAEREKKRNLVGSRK